MFYNYAYILIIYLQKQPKECARCPARWAAWDGNGRCRLGIAAGVIDDLFHVVGVAYFFKHVVGVFFMVVANGLQCCL